MLQKYDVKQNGCSIVREVIVDTSTTIKVHFGAIINWNDLRVSSIVALLWYTSDEPLLQVGVSVDTSHSQSVDVIGNAINMASGLEASSLGAVNCAAVSPSNCTEAESQFNR